MINHAIIGTDFSKAVSEIIKHAIIFKTIGITKITLIHVLNLRDRITTESFSIEGLEQKLAQQKTALLQFGFEVESKLTYGIPHIELEMNRIAENAGLIIVGSHGRTSTSSTIGGTISDILQNMKAPVLVIPLKKMKSDLEEFPGRNLYQYEQIMQHLEKLEPDWELKCKTLVDHVLFATDFSDFSESAFQWVRNQQVKFQKVTLFHVQDEVKIGKHLENKLDEFNTIDSERLNRLVNSFKTSHPESDIQFRITYGKPIPEILKFIKENNISLTVAGSQGRGFFSEIFLGSVSHQVARNADSNILIVPIQSK